MSGYNYIQSKNDEYNNQCIKTVNIGEQNSDLITTICDNDNQSQKYYFDIGTWAIFQEIKSSGKLTRLCIEEDDISDALVNMRPCDGRFSQQWTWDPIQQQIYNRGSGKCIAIDGQAFDGTPNIISRECQFTTTTGLDNWILISTADSSTSSSQSNGSSSSNNSCDEVCQQEKLLFISLMTITIILISGSLVIIIVFGVLDMIQNNRFKGIKQNIKTEKKRLFYHESTE